jgi:hypothetical protein
VIVEVLPQPLLLTTVAPPELPLDPELEPPLAPESPVAADPLLEPEPVEMPELDVEPPPGVPELDPTPPPELPELDGLPEEEAAASLSGELSLAELLPHALAIAARHARHPVSDERRRALLVTLSVSICVHGPHPAVASGPAIRHSHRVLPHHARPSSSRVGHDLSRKLRHRRNGKAP